MINDVHCHFFSSRFLELLAPEAGGAGRRRRPVAMGPAGHGDRAGGPLGRPSSIATASRRAALIASIPGDAASVAEAVAHHPDRFVGFFMHNPAGPDADAVLRAVAERVSAARHLPVSGDARLPAGRRAGGARVSCGRRDTARRSSRTAASLTVGVRKKLGLPSRFDLRLGDPLALARTALGFPQVPVIVPHFGAGFFREALMAADQCPTIHLDTSSSNSWIRFDGGQTLEAVFRSALAVAGPSRLLFGTDSSFFPRGWQAGIYEEQQRIMGSLGVSVPDRHAIFAGNFERLFPA